MTLEQGEIVISMLREQLFLLKAIMLGVAFLWAASTFFILIKAAGSKWFFGK